MDERLHKRAMAIAGLLVGLPTVAAGGTGAMLGLMAVWDGKYLTGDEYTLLLLWSSAGIIGLLSWLWLSGLFLWRGVAGLRQSPVVAWVGLALWLGRVGRGRRHAVLHDQQWRDLDIGLSVWPAAAGDGRAPGLAALGTRGIAAARTGLSRAPQLVGHAGWPECRRFRAGSICCGALSQVPLRRCHDGGNRSLSQAFHALPLLPTCRYPGHRLARL